MKRLLKSIIAVVLIGVITLCGILILQKVFGRARIDLTQNRLYTLSAGTRHIIAQLNQPVTLKLYYSRVGAMKGPEAIRFYNSYYLYVRDLLEEYVKLSKGKLKLELLDPRPFSDAEEDAMNAGLKRFQLSESESFFFGLVGVTELGKTQVIEFFEPDRQEFVEYDISKLISTLEQREKKKIGILASVPITGMDMSPYMMQMMRMQGRQPEPPWGIVTHLREQYDVQSIPTDTDAIPADVDYLMVVHPKDLKDRTLFAIDQYVMKGGKLMVFVDPYCLMDRPQQDPQNPFGNMGQKQSSDLNRLLSGWGVEMQQGAIAVDRALAIRAQLQQQSPPQAFLPYMNLDERCMNEKEPVTGKLHSVRVFCAGVLDDLKTPGVQVVPLLETTSTGSIWRPSNPWELQMPNPAAIQRAVTDGTKPLMLGCRITGTLKTNFPGGPPPPEPARPGMPPGMGPEEEGMEPELPAPAPQPQQPKAEPAKPETPKTEPAQPETPKTETPKTEPAKTAPAQPETKPPAQKGEPASGGGGADMKADEKPAPKTDEAKPAPKADEAKPEAKAEAKPSPKTDEAKPAPRADEAKPEPAAPAFVKESPPNTVVLVFADVDMLSNMLAYQESFFGLAQVGDNASLVLNSLDYLSGSGDLIAIRSRGKFNRPFVVVDRIEQAAEKGTATEVEALQAKIQEYQDKLRKLGEATGEKEQKLVRSTVLAEREKVQKDIREAQRKLRLLNAGKRRQIEALKIDLETHNMVWAPAAVLLIAIVIWLVRLLEARSYRARRTQ